MPTRGTLFEQAFEEFRVTRQVSTGNGAMYCAMTEFPFRSGRKRIPGWFVRSELGYDGPIGSRLYEMPSQRDLDERHKAAWREEEKGIAAPTPMPKKQKKQPRETRYSRRAKLDQLEVRAMLAAQAAQYEV